ncbi:MAG: LysM peptidoglycan-binding domain-containing protein [Lachnospiraceae bacterium]|jgi:LysM repeat protein|nr:LysM peptidoglycan-binding domain-containing protein [Lachnospiraceae bacterium]
MAIGYLLIQARTAHDAVPLGGVHVKILGERGESLYDLITDENGETGKVPLETLDKSFSQNEYYSGLPYKSYNVMAQKEGFDMIYVTQIPIYEGETAVQPLMLVPMEQRQTRPGQSKIFVGKPAVAMQETRSQEGQEESPQVLRQVVIPNPITVHLGAPGSYASNVQVSFPDYVKNVASSEIYPTWPEASLRANIYAIITFALNRVFTEWYTAKGYDYDITNSTAYDQYFVYGRPIYESISRVVDDIFNEYVRRQGQNAPYFTSFCNGSTVRCDGMSQWGTVSLAENGYTPLQILRYYYPNDVEIVEAQAVANVPSSYPGTALREGSTGLDVQTIQTYLNRIRRNYPAIPVIRDPEGTFGESTKAAVTKFQSIFGLAADGIVGKSTWYKISSLYTAVTRLAELDSEGTSLGIGTVPPSSVLRQGARGQDVITLQYLLDVISEYYPTVPAPAQDGIFGGGTQRAVTAFQNAVRLAPDGIVGPATWKKLYEVYRGIGTNVPGQNGSSSGSGSGGSGTTTPPGTGGGVQEYVVKAGDSLWLIAQRFHTTVDAIKSLNGLTTNLLNVGQVLKIPAAQSAPYVEYTVRSGDTLWLLSRRYDTTVDAIKQLNGLTSDMLSIGQVLKIPVR